MAVPTRDPDRPFVLGATAIGLLSLGIAWICRNESATDRVLGV